MLFRRLLEKAEGERSEWEYPFAVAGINVTFMLEELVEMRDDRTGVLLVDRMPVGAPARGFIGLLSCGDTVFEEVLPPPLAHLHGRPPFFCTLLEISLHGAPFILLLVL